jgi:hypothetical protein
LITLQSSKLETLLTKAKEHEKNYEWLQAADYYNKLSDLVLKQNDSLKTVEFDERTGVCLYKAAFQAQNNTEFAELMKKAIQLYKIEAKLLEEEITQENKQVKIDQINAYVTYAQSWLVTKPSKKKEILAKWWTLENKVLAAHERRGDLYSVGKICNDMIECSHHQRFWLGSDFSEYDKMFKELLSLAEKAIESLSKFDDDYELGRAYCFAGWYNSWGHFLWGPDDVRVREMIRKSDVYSRKALELSQKTGDAGLIGWSYISAIYDVQTCKGDSILGSKYGKEAIAISVITKDNLLLGSIKNLVSMLNIFFARAFEDPDKQRDYLEIARKMAQESGHCYKIIDNPSFSYQHEALALGSLAQLETDITKKQDLIETSIKVIYEGIEQTSGWKWINGSLFTPLGLNLHLLSELESEPLEKRELLRKAKNYAKKEIGYQEELIPFNPMISLGYLNFALIQKDLAKIETNRAEKNRLLTSAVRHLKKCLQKIEKNRKIDPQLLVLGKFLGPPYEKVGRTFQQIYSLNKEKKMLLSSIESYNNAILAFKNSDFPTYLAESYWHEAQLMNQLSDHQKASENYELASEAYNRSAKKIPQLKEFYTEHSNYMLAWSEIEQAKYSHATEDYEEAKQHYEKAAKLHESTGSWSYLASNYFAWSCMEEAEDLSRKEKTQLAKQMFQKAFEQFCNAEMSFKQKLEGTASVAEKEMTQTLFEASDLRRKYCQARIFMEDAKLLDRKGRYLQSSKKYKEAEENISTLIKKIDVEAERKELEYISILCRAWEKMAVAEEATSSESYLEAAELFKDAKDYCYTSKASLWALGNSNFCKGLAAGVRYQTGLDLGEHAKAKSFMKSASTHYAKAGFKAASEYAKATLRLFDAYLVMNQAEIEVDQEKRAKHYQMAENLLQIAAGSFMKAKQPEKTDQVQGILANVREEKALAISLSQVMQAPTIASSTLSFSAPSPTSESSVGLEKFEHANVQANLVTSVKQVKIGESFCLSVEFVNAGREPALLMRVEDFINPDFIVVKKPEIYRIEDTCLNMKGKQIAPLKLVEVKLTLQPSKKGEYSLNPRVQYLDELGQNKSLQLKTLEIKVEEVIIEGRVTTGTQELDSLLLGGIPQEYAVILSGPPCDEREMIVKNFLKVGVKKGISFYVATEANETRNLLDSPNFFLFLCNPKPKTPVPDMPNVFKLQGKTDLNNLGIALTKAHRSINQNLGQPKRICIEILSEVLVKHGANTTREWISDLITNYGSKGFIMLAVMDPKEHAPDEATTVLNLFDGEISILQSDDPLDCKKSIIVKKLRNQDYIKNPICLT